MSAGGTFQNDSLPNYHIFLPATSSSTLASISASINHQSYQNPNYCVLPSLHNHPIDQTLGADWSLIDDNLDETLKLLETQNELQSGGKLYADTSKETKSIQVANQLEHSVKSGRLSSAESSTNSKNGNLLDPYIDAVQVKRRVNNKRGDRVKAANGGGNQQIKMVHVKDADRLPDSSYYSKSVHIEESNGAGKEWDYSSYESDSDDEDHQHHYSGHKKRRKKKGKKKYFKKPKKVYVAKVHYAKPLKHHEHYEHDGYHHKHKNNKYHKHYEPEHEKKIVYVNYEKPGEKHHEHGYHHYEHDKHNHYHNYHHKKHHDDHYHDKSKGKLVHLNVMSKGRMSLAGILGQTLLCVNYLLVLKQPTYDKYSSHYYTTYSPHGGHGDMVEVKSRGPIILAHCGELPEARSLVPGIAFAGAATELDKSRLPTLPSQVLAETNGANQKEHRTASDQDLGLANVAIPIGNSTSQMGVLNLKKDLRTNLTTAEQQAELVYLNGGTRRLAPDSYTRYQSLADYQADQPMVSRSGSTSLLSPIQSYLNRLLFVSPQSEPETTTANEIETDSLRVVSSPVRRRIRVQNVDDDGDLIQPLRQAAFVDSREALVAPNRRLVIVPGGQPQLVQTRDNLVDLRTRRVPIVMRVTDGLRFGLNQRLLSLTQQQQAQAGLESPLGLAVRAPDQLIQNDQPQEDVGNERSITANEVSGGANGQRLLLDAPEYAIAGDSIELTCNHRILPDRLYSVRWFKDSVEFYRFVPNNSPMKSSLVVPDVIIDIQRSNSQSLYLRNVTHRSSGLYRCEVISEAPNFELVIGERQMQVYSLPSTGPRLNLLDRDEPTTTTTTIVASNGRLRTISSVASDGIVRTGAQLLGTRPTITSVGREIEDDNEENQQNWPPVSDNRIGLQTGARQHGAGPIIKCVSDRSNPVAQLQFLVNNRPVPSSRTIENATLSYSDGLESNVISFRVQLADFVLNANDQSSLDKAASLKSAADGTNGNGTQNAQTTAAISTTTTTTTTTTKRPKLNIARGKSENGERKKNERQNVEDANAAVQFDDHAGDVLSNSKAIEVNNRKGVPKEKQKKDKNRTGPKSNRFREPGDKMINSDAIKEEDADNSVRTVGHSDRNPELGPLPAERAQTKLVGVVAGGQQQRVGSNATETNGYTSSVSKIGKRHLVQSNGSVDELLHVANNESGLATTAPSYGDADNLNGAEQRNSVANRVRSRIPNSAQQRQQIVYSNFIRIKCVSTVPTLGYEMISELNVPLTLIVPASRLSDALRQPTNNAGPRSSNVRDDNDSRLEEGRSDGDVDNDTNGNQNNDRRQQQGRKTVSNAGSLQKPRAVVIDRVAQASGLRSSSVVYNSQQGRSAGEEKVESNQGDTSYRGKMFARHTEMRASNSAECNLALSMLIISSVLLGTITSLVTRSFHVTNMAMA